jgi:hypothetical protein
VLILELNKKFIREKKLIKKNYAQKKDERKKKLMASKKKNCALSILSVIIVEE